MTVRENILSGPALARALINPRSVALYGASEDTTKMGGRPVQFLKRSGFSGRVYPINPKCDLIQGLRAYPSISSLPEAPDHVYVLTPTETVMDAVRECAAHGVKLVSVLASGFSESGPEGLAREQALKELAHKTGIRILGPSSLGTVNPRSGLMLTANAAFAEPDMPMGNVFVASHSGSMIGSLVSRGKARGVGFAGLISVGSEVDLSIGEICHATLDDPGIEGYLLFLESMRHGAELQRFAREAASRGKPVIAYKLGRSAVAAEMATTHTGALAGEDDIADAFLKDLGVARVEMIESLLEAFPLARRVLLPTPAAVTPHRVGVVTTTGGGAAMVVDQLSVRGVEVGLPSKATLAKLKEANIPGSAGRVLDLTLAGTKYEVMKSALDILLEAPEFDLVIAVVGSSARFQPHLAVKPILDSAGHIKPLIAALIPDAPQALAQLTQAGVPCFRTPESCADVVASVLARRVPGELACTLVNTGSTTTLSEVQAYKVLDVLKVPHAPVHLLPLEGSKTLKIPFGYPVAVKVCSPDIPHKTEVDGVVLGVRNEQELSAALAVLRGNLARKAPAGVCCDGVLVQPMMCGLAEVLVGYRIDREAGPIIMLAAGGIWAELARDRIIRLAPVSIETAWEMIHEVKALKSVTGLRGKPKGDLSALAKAISDLSQLAVRPDLGVLEAEVNPMMVLGEGQGVLAVDALMVRQMV